MRTLDFSEFVVVSHNDSMAKVIKALSIAEVQFAVVVEGSGFKLLGVVTGGDIVRHIGQSFELQHYLAGEVIDYCNTSPITLADEVFSDADLDELRACRIQYVPVSNDLGELKSVVEVYP